MSYNIKNQKIRTVWWRIAIPTVNNHSLPYSQQRRTSMWVFFAQTYNKRG